MNTNKAPKSIHWTVEDYVSGILNGDRVVLGRAITLIESTKAAHREMANTILEKCLPHTGQSFRIGITGPPGVGKSSFIEAFGEMLVKEHGRKVAVLAIDPSSSVSGGSILGDKTRMEKLGNEANAFIRPSPAGTTLGGVANCTHKTMLLCEAAGFDTIIIETVGVGQSETAVAGMVDFFLLLLLPGAGDELQGIKRGIVELADLIAVNKADGERMELAKMARKDYAQALHFFPMKQSGWTPKAITCSALTKEGLQKVWSLLLEYQSLVKQNGWFVQNRNNQQQAWFSTLLVHSLEQLFFETPNVKASIETVKSAVQRGESTPAAAVASLIKLFKLSISESQNKSQ